MGCVEGVRWPFPLRRRHLSRHLRNKRVGRRCGPRPLQASKPPCTLKLYFIVTDTEAYESSNMPSDGAASEGRKSSRVCLTCCSVPVNTGHRVGGGVDLEALALLPGTTAYMIGQHEREHT